MHSTISSRGRTAVPAEVRRRFHLKERSRLEWIVDGDVITVLPVPSIPIRSLRGTLNGKYSAKALRKARKEERARERRGA